MSRLDKAIRRLEAQRALLDRASADILARHRPSDGVVVELGLGNGRTYHHLRERLPGFRIVVFEREPTAHPASTPEAGDLVVGEIEHAVPQFCIKETARAVLIHADLGNGYESYDREIERWLPGSIQALAQPGAIVLSSTRLSHPRLEPQSHEITDYEYYRFRLTADYR